MRHSEIHRMHRVGWLRAAVLGANDGIVSTASLVLGVAAAEATRSGILTAGVAGLVAGAMSMAAGEYVSVSSQKDTEQADLERERGEAEVDHGCPRPHNEFHLFGCGLLPLFDGSLSQGLLPQDAPFNRC